MARILIHRSHPVDAKAPVTGFSFTVEYGEGGHVRFADLPIPPSSGEHSVAAFRQELRRLATAILNVAASGKDIHWDRSANSGRQRLRGTSSGFYRAESFGKASADPS